MSNNAERDPTMAHLRMMDGDLLPVDPLSIIEIRWKTPAAWGRTFVQTNHKDSAWRRLDCLMAFHRVVEEVARAFDALRRKDGGAPADGDATEAEVGDA